MIFRSIVAEVAGQDAQLIADKQGAAMASSKLTLEEIDKGYRVCPCGKFAHVFRPAVLARLPALYFGDLCQECGLLMVAIEKLEESK